MKRMSASQCYNNTDMVVNVTKEGSLGTSAMLSMNECCSYVRENSQNLENELKENKSVVKPGKQITCVIIDDDFTCKQCKTNTHKIMPITPDTNMSTCKDKSHKDNSNKHIVTQIFDPLKDDKYDHSSYRSFCSWCFRITSIVLCLMAVGLALFVYVSRSGKHTCMIANEDPQIQSSHEAQTAIDTDTNNNTDSHSNNGSDSNTGSNSNTGSDSNTDIHVNTGSDSNSIYAGMFELDQLHLEDEKQIRWMKSGNSRSSDGFSALTAEKSCIVVPVSGIYGVFTTITFKYYNDTDVNAVGYFLEYQGIPIQKTSITLPSIHSRATRSLIPASLSTFTGLSKNDKICVNVEPEIIKLVFISKLESYISVFKLPY